MRALTISQPYASLIASGEKWVENRTWYTAYRGPLAIHAGKNSRYLTKRELETFPRGCIVAVARLVACLKLDELDATEAAVRICFSSHTIGQLLDHEHTEGPYCWVLDDVRKLTKRIPWSGAQGLWLFPDSFFSPAAG